MPVEVPVGFLEGQPISLLYTYKGMGDYLPYKNDLDAGPGTWEIEMRDHRLYVK